jgi:60 kDa SS-A/Ro ribonucleoprotein
MHFTRQQLKDAIDAGLVTVSQEHKNNAGGYVFKVTPMQQAQRIVILGVSSGTYYEKANDLLKESMECFEQVIRDGSVQELVAMIVNVSVNGLAPRQDTILFTLAWLSCHERKDVRQAVYSVLDKVLRTPTDQIAFLFKWRKSIRESRSLNGVGWGRGVRTVMRKYYENTPPQQLAYHITKYQKRDGVEQSDLLRLVHPAVGNKRKRDQNSTNLTTSDREQPAKNMLFKFATKKIIGDVDESSSQEEKQMHAYLSDVTEALNTTNVERVVELIRRHRLVREQISTPLLNEKSVWGALLEKMPMNALLRNLASMTAHGVFLVDEYRTLACDAMRNPDAIQKARIHPLSVYKAIKVYDLGHGEKGSNTWFPNRDIQQAMQNMFLASFKYAVEPDLLAIMSELKIMVALDVSGSMDQLVSGMNMSCREVSAVMSLSILSAGGNNKVDVCSFDCEDRRGGVFNASNATGLHVFDGVSKNTSLREFMAHPNQTWHGAGTDCSLPMMWATRKNKAYDAFIIFTDNETWFGKVKPFEALAEHALATKNPHIKLIVCAMTATSFSIADPSNPNMMDIVGCDSSLPSIITNFIAGRF